MSLHPICMARPTLTIEGDHFTVNRGEWHGDVLIWGQRILMMLPPDDVRVVTEGETPVPGMTYRLEVQATGPTGSTIVYAEDVGA